MADLPRYNYMLGYKFSTNANKISEKHKNLSIYIKRRIAGLLNKKAKAVLEKVKQYSSFQYVSLSNLHRMGHPYARRYFKGNKFAKRVVKGWAVSIPATFLVNKQSGALHRNWRKTDGFVNSRHNSTYVRIYNLKKESSYLKGTKYMVRRPIVQTAIKMVDRTSTPLSKQVSDIVRNSMRDSNYKKGS